ncbi:MAG: SufE family protein [Cytophagales bacterium]
MKSPEDIQNEIIEEFTFLGDDREAMINYIMELGERLEPLKDSDKVEDNIIKGCQSKVWLISELKDGKVHFTADSNTSITKGLISLLIRVLNDRSPKEIIDTDLFFMEKIGMSNMIGSQRSNGFVSMIKKMKIFALAYQGQLQKE